MDSNVHTTTCRHHWRKEMRPLFTRETDNLPCRPKDHTEQQERNGVKVPSQEKIHPRSIHQPEEKEKAPLIRGEESPLYCTTKIFVGL